MPSKKSPKKETPFTGAAYQLKITLRRSQPPIWRRIRVPADCALETLHAAIQAAMGWYNCHLHCFEIGGREYVGRDPMGQLTDTEGLDAARYRLSDLVRQEKTKFNYQYDFGDSWDHLIMVEKVPLPMPVGAATESSQPFVCLAGKGACPPEDCGGVWGYQNLLQILNNPKHREHAEMMEWAGGIIDPDAFDLEAANARLRWISKI